LQRQSGAIGNPGEVKKSNAVGKTVSNIPKNVGGIFRGAKQERTLWVDAIYMLKKKTLLPAVVFTFSRRKCEENADGLASMDLTSPFEKNAIHIFLEGSIAKLKPVDRTLPQICRMREMLSRGVAVHHSGLLPLLKEAVEILFARGLVRVLFATETFAMGVNMPAKTVLFSSIRKHDGNGFRTLLPGEYTQMAGRAGRRGLDDTGTVIIAAPEEVPGEAVLRQTILGTPTKLTSRFRLTYTMLLCLLRVQALRVEEMIKQSFSEHAGQCDLPAEQAKFAENEALLAQAANLDCRICSDMSEYYGATLSILEYGFFVHERLLQDTKMVGRLLEPGRIVIINDGMSLENCPAVILRVLNGPNPKFSCMALWNKNTKSDSGSAGLPLPITFVTIPDLDAQLTRDTFTLSPSNLILITTARIRVPLELGNTSIYRPTDLDSIQDELIRFLKQHNGPFTEIDIPHFRSIDVDEKKLNRLHLMSQLSHFACRRCPDLLEHFTIYHRRRLLTEQLAESQFRLSDNSLLLLPEYHARVALLKTLGYVDVAGNVQLKGRVACELNTVDELVITELLFDNAFAAMEPAEIVALLSALVFQERHIDEPQLTGKLKDGFLHLQGVAKRLRELQLDHGVDVGETRVHPGLIEVVYQWALGTPFTELILLTDVLEGAIVRCIVRLDETCRELRGAARIMGDPLLYRKMEEASTMIKRDICFASSLYL
jgi:antiviral helicase SKI2